MVLEDLKVKHRDLYPYREEEEVADSADRAYREEEVHLFAPHSVSERLF